MIARWMEYAKEQKNIRWREFRRSQLQEKVNVCQYQNDL